MDCGREAPLRLGGLSAKKKPFHTAGVLAHCVEKGHLSRGAYVADPLPEPRTAAQTVGVVYSEENEFFRPIFAGVDAELRDAGYRPAALFEGRQEGGEDRLLRRLGEDKVCGLIAVPSRVDAEHRELIRLVTRHFPVVLMDHYLPGISCDAVTTDNEADMEAMTRHLLGLGHRRIGFITETVQYPYSTSVRERNAGVKRALRAAGITDADQWVVAHGPPELGDPEFLNNVDRAIETLFRRSRDRQLTAIMCVTDSLARAAAACLERRGLRVPDDLSLTGFDDLAWSAEFTPPLTTVAQPLDRIGRRAVRLLLDRLQHPEQPPVRVVLDYRLVLRASTAPPPVL
mgnify:CR=1 FL=1